MDEQPELQYRNTRSKFYKKKNSSESPEKSSSKHSSSKEKTSGYWKEKGNNQFKNNNFEAAIANYSKAIELNPTESVYYSNRARCMYSLGQIEKALKDSQESIEMDDKNIKGHYICGCCLAEMSKKDIKKIDLAIKELKKALTLCRGQSKESFEEQVHLALYRAKKLKWYLSYERQVKQSNRIVDLLKKSAPEDARKLKEILQSKRPSFEIPDNLCCKITLELMEDPVVSAAGVTYEKQALLEHFRHNGCKDPFTNKVIPTQIYPNHAIKSGILEFLDHSPWAFEYSKGDNPLNIKL